MNTLKTLGVMTLFVLCAIGIATSAFTQPGIGGAQQAGGQPGQPNGMPPKRPQLPVMHAGVSGLFVLEGTTLTKYDAATLKQLGNLQLVENIAAKADATAGNNAGRPKMGQTSDGAFLVVKIDNTENLLVIAGDQFTRITAQDFKVAVKQALPVAQMAPPPGGPEGPDGPGAPAANAGKTGGKIEKAFAAGPDGNNEPQGGPGGAPNGAQQGMRPPPPAQAPTLELFNNILYVLRGNQLLAIDVTTGTVLAQGTTSNGRLMGGPPQ